jgi:hypothetical protein
VSFSSDYRIVHSFSERLSSYRGSCAAGPIDHSADLHSCRPITSDERSIDSLVTPDDFQHGARCTFPLQTPVGEHETIKLVVAFRRITLAPLHELNDNPISATCFAVGCGKFKDCARVAAFMRRLVRRFMVLHVERQPIFVDFKIGPQVLAYF